MNNENRVIAGVACTLVAGFLLVGAQSGAHAQTSTADSRKESSITLYGGYRFGGSFEDETSGQDWDLQDDVSYSLALDIGLDRRSQVQIFVGYQDSALKAGDFAPTADNIEMGITYLHVGGVHYLSEAGRGGYVMGGLGATYFDPDESGLNSETKFSFNLGGGYMLPLGRHVGIRIEARGFVTLVNNDGGMFCSGGACAVQIKGETLIQGDVMVGLSLRF